MIRWRIRTRRGIEEVSLRQRSAIMAMCRECLGFETEPRDCTSPLCALFPFRTGDAHSGRKVTEEQKAKFATRMKLLRSNP
jgi:hypothetical protein